MDSFFALEVEQTAVGISLQLDTYTTDLIEEFKAFFTSNVNEKEGSRVFSRDLFNAFTKSRKDRGGVVTKLEMEMFWRHGKRLFMTLFPNCKYTAYKHQRCYLHVGFATNSSDPTCAS